MTFMYPGSSVDRRGGAHLFQCETKMGEYDNDFDGCYLEGNDTLLDSVNGSCKKKTVNLNKSEAHMDTDDECHYGVLLTLADCEEDPDYASIAEGCSSPVQFDSGIRTGEHRIIKHKASTITFSDYGFSSSGLSSTSAELFINEGSDADSSSSEDEDDVFTELPQYREFLISRHRRTVSRNKQKEEPLNRIPEALPGWSRDTRESSSTSSNETEEDFNMKQEAVQSPWSQSMTQLMKKLDQLNVDIEEALSASTSPSGTPAVKRRETCAVTLETALNQALHKKKLFKNKDPECSRLDSLPYSSSILPGLGARPKAEMPLKMSKEEAEIEAKEACDWLRAAGFPQYAQLYEDSQFPIDIPAVKRDHDFLEKDLVEPLCRRLNTLNKCASMKLDVNLPRKKSEDSDEEDLFAISDKWTFQRSSRRWSRLEDIDSFLCRSESQGPLESMTLKNTTSSESVLTELSEPEVSSLHSESSGGSESRSLAATNSATTDCFDSSKRNYAETTIMLDSSLVNVSHPQAPKDITNYVLSFKNDRQTRTKAKDFLKRMETLRAKSTSGKAKCSGKSGTVVISGPMLLQEPESLKAMHYVDLVNGDLEGLLVEPFQGCSPLQSSSDSSHLETSDSTVSTSSLKDRKVLHAAHKRSGMYLEDVDIFSGSHMKKVAEQNRRNEFRSHENLVVHIPKDHKPGTFPKALSIESLSPTNSGSSVNWHTGSVCLDRNPPHSKEPRPTIQCFPRGSRISIYDNVPGSHLYASTGDLLDLEKEDLFPHLDDILQHVNGLQQIVDHWSKNVLPEDGSIHGESGLQSSSQITLDFEGNSVLDGRITPSDRDKDGVSLNESESVGMRERRDSGVGASLTRPNRMRWPSFQISHCLSRSMASLQIRNQSAGQLSLLQRFSLLRLTAIMEKYSMSNKHGWAWSVPRFMKRMKVPDYKDKHVFGVPLIVHVQRTGQPLPQSLQQALRFLRSQCLDQVGLFRKSGVKSRILALRQMNESSPENVNYEDQSAYDVADMVKQFFRDLPEPLLTSKLGETFLHIYQYVPKDQRLQAVQAAIMLMSDENREVLQTLLCFLSDVTSVEENQMTPMNIAVCLAPSLFHLNILKENLSPRAMQKKYATGRPDQKDLNENLAATQGLAHMIMECNRLFEISTEMVTQSRNSYVEANVHAMTLEEMGKQLEEDSGTYQMYLENLTQALLKEAREKSKGWVTCSTADNTELAYKKVGDGNPLRLWKVSVEVEAPPSVVLNRVLRERHLWDDDFLQWKVIETLDKQTEIFQYVLNSMAPHPSRDFLVLRSWRTDLPKGTCALVVISVDLEEAPPIGGVRAVVLDSQYLLEPCGSGKSRLTHICRMDLKGRTPDWYSKAFGYLCATEAARIRNSFHPLTAEGPETKI